MFNKTYIFFIFKFGCPPSLKYCFVLVFNNPFVFIWIAVLTFVHLLLAEITFIINISTLKWLPNETLSKRYHWTFPEYLYFRNAFNFKYLYSNGHYIRASAVMESCNYHHSTFKVWSSCGFTWNVPASVPGAYKKLGALESPSVC